ncbi:hypothetical protein MATL_G00251180 [Megalops atlanticus]|uniref:Dual specificity phosphatase 16 n=1 Tax=Megalops atlanticus TaxID=7932 RepID=A0A9D3PBE4_MEGAT|nr:hypothetical protein MATL_G00251180 [Megalops atlanticus]
MSERPVAGSRLGGVRPMGAEALVALLEGGLDHVLLIDSRPFVDYNASHILEAVNVNCSKLMKRRLQQDKVQITELLQHSARSKVELQVEQEVVVYDQSSADPASLSSEAFLSVLLAKLEKNFSSVHLLSGGFAQFSHLFPGLCEGRSVLVPSCISQPCLPVANVGPTRILPHLYLGCQRDVLNKDLMQQNGIAYVLNASNTCPKPDFIPESHFLRVPVNDSFCEKILPWLDKSVEFIERAKASNARVLVHCLAGISRSATIAIAYIMKRMDMSLDEAYRFVKEKRPTISPNFNFLGQLLDFEKKIKTPLGPLGAIAKLTLLHPAGQEEGVNLSASETAVGPAPLQLPVPNHISGECVEVCPLARGLDSLCLGGAEGGEESIRLKRSFSLDIKSRGGSSGHAPEGVEHHKASAFKETASKPCQFSPVEEVSEQSTPEHSPDKEQVDTPSATHPHPLHRSGSMEDGPRAASFLLGLSSSQQHLARPGVGHTALKGWHSDILAPAASSSSSSLASGWYFSSDSARIYSASVLFGGSGSGFPAAVRRREKGSDRGDSRRSWHEESPFEKQLKRRSCQMEFGDGGSEGRHSREELGKVGSQSSFSGSMEIIEVS